VAKLKDSADNSIHSPPPQANGTGVRNLYKRAKRFFANLAKRSDPTPELDALPSRRVPLFTRRKGSGQFNFFTSPSNPIVAPNSIKDVRKEALQIVSRPEKRIRRKRLPANTPVNIPTSLSTSDNLVTPGIPRFHYPNPFAIPAFGRPSSIPLLILIPPSPPLPNDLPIQRKPYKPTVPSHYGQKPLGRIRRKPAPAFTSSPLDFDANGRMSDRRRALLAALEPPSLLPYTMDAEDTSVSFDGVPDPTPMTIELDDLDPAFDLSSASNWLGDLRRPSSPTHPHAWRALDGPTTSTSLYPHVSSSHITTKPLSSFPSNSSLVSNSSSASNQGLFVTTTASSSVTTIGDEGKEHSGCAVKLERPRKDWLLEGSSGATVSEMGGGAPNLISLMAAPAYPRSRQRVRDLRTIAGRRDLWGGDEVGSNGASAGPRPGPSTRAKDTEPILPLSSVRKSVISLADRPYEASHSIPRTRTHQPRPSSYITGGDRVESLLKAKLWPYPEDATTDADIWD
ncbi:hypothetical protein FRB96_006574, partial [Tulasnella sp. 330]